METLIDKEMKLGQPEIERKFLVDPTQIPDLSGLAQLEIEQIYFNSSDDEFEIRIRRKNDRYSATLKSSGDLVRDELGVEITPLAYHRLSQAGGSQRIRKNRFFLLGGVHIDIYGPEQQGLVVAELEFDSVASAKNFQPLPWMGSEITHQPEFKNRNLVDYNMPRVVPNEPEVRQEVVKHLYSWRRTGRPVIIGIAGSTASGKTTFAQKLAEDLGEGVPIISIDDFNRGRRAMEKTFGGRFWQDWDSPFVYDTSSLAEQIKAYKAGQPIKKPIFSFKTAEPSGYETIPRKSILIVEGLYALDGNLLPQIDVPIFVDANLTDRILRRLVRDVERTGWPAEEIFAYIMSWAEPANQEFVQPQKAKARFVVNT